MSQTGTFIKTWDLIDDSGNTLISFTSFLKSEYKAEAQTVQQPTEEGTFATYNKVIDSRPVSVSLAIDGLDSTIAAAIQSLENLRVTASKCQIVTPYGLSPISTLISYNYSHKRNEGLGLLLVDLKFVEIREVSADVTQAESSSSSADSQGGGAISEGQASNPSDVSTSEAGRVQTQEPQQSSLVRLQNWATS